MLKLTRSFFILYYGGRMMMTDQINADWLVTRLSGWLVLAGLVSW
jgi:hypothetical protein